MVVKRVIWQRVVTQEENKDPPMYSRFFRENFTVWSLRKLVSKPGVSSWRVWMKPAGDVLTAAGYFTLHKLQTFLKKRQTMLLQNLWSAVPRTSLVRRPSLGLTSVLSLCHGCRNKEHFGSTNLSSNRQKVSPGRLLADNDWSFGAK